MKFKVLITILFFSFISTNIGVIDSKTSKINKIQEKAIIIYGSGTCHYCVDTKTYLTKKNIPFVFFDLDIYPQKIEEMYVKLRKANISTADFQIPVVDKGGEIITNDYETFEVFLSKLDKS